MVTDRLPSEWEAAEDAWDLAGRVVAPFTVEALNASFIAAEETTAFAERAIEHGLYGLTLPSRFGGLGRGYTALAAACEALGRVDTSFQVSLTVHLGLVAMSILQWGTPAQHEQWLPDLATGRRVGTFGLTEPGAGSDVAALRMRATAVDGGWLLNGEKSWISSANGAEVFLLFATVDRDLRHRGITCFIVPRESAGLSTTKLRGKLGVRLTDTGSVFCDQVFVPKQNALGEVGEGFAIALAALGNGLFTVGCGALGIAAATRCWTVDFVRRLGLSADGWAAAELAHMVAREETARLLLARAASLKDEGRPNTRETGLAKWVASTAAYDNAQAALAISAAHQSGEETTLLRHWANAKGAVIYGGTSEIHQTMQAAFALGDRRERPFRMPPLDANELR